MAYKLGKGPAVRDARNLRLEDYTLKLPKVPGTVDYISKVPSWPMFGNDTLGDCVAAAAGHMVMNWTEYAGALATPTETQIVDFYSNSGYVPGQPSTDQGWDLLPALKVWKTNGIGGGGQHKIVAYVELTTGSWGELRQAVTLFGNAYVGFQLPDYVVPEGPGAPDWTEIPWVYQNGAQPDPNNGHCIPIMAYAPADSGDALGQHGRFVSWAAVMHMNAPFYENFSDEAYAVVTQDWIEKDGLSPSGFDTAQLLADLVAL